MFLELLRKEFIEKSDEGKQSLFVSVLFLVFRGLLLGCFIALECFIAMSLDKKIVKYSSYGSFDFLVLAMTLTMALSIIFTMVKARKTLFDSNDSQVTLPLPIEPSTQVFSKVTYLYIEAVLFGWMTSTPILVCYGIPRHFIPYYYIFSFLYPFLISIFSIGISLLLTIVYQKLYCLVRKNDIVQFLVACILVITLCYLYQVVLTLFLTALNNSSIGGVFSKDFVETLHKARYYFLPVYHLLDAVIEKANLKSDILITIGASILSLLLGVSLSSIVYFRELKNQNQPTSKKTKEKKLQVVSPFKALLKKETDLLFKDETNLFSYTSLLILCPFLTYAVISSLNSIIYDNLRFYASYFPELVSGINLTLILLFSGVINASASLSMTREGQALIIVKYLPISPLKQILAKIIIPMLFSFLSLFVTVIVLISAGIITLPVFFTSFFVGVLLIIFSNVFGVYCDMHDRDRQRRTIRLSLINDLVPLILPFLIFALFFLFSVYLKLPTWSLYLIASFVSLLLLSPSMINLKKRYQKAFVRMEVSN